MNDSFSTSKALLFWCFKGFLVIIFHVMRKKTLPLGPAAMVAAAFIGPGTVTTASLVGANFAYELIWAVLFSILATIVLQEMAARLGVVGKMGLGEAVRKKITRPLSYFFSAALILSAILIGNAAYETGNITGALLGIPALPLSLSDKVEVNAWIPIMGLLAFFLLYFGAYPLIEKVLIFAVGLMSLIFVLTAILLRPPLEEILRGMLVPSIPEGGLFYALALIGTTIVPYNLFLHASGSKKRWKDASDLRAARLDTYISVAVGGLITIAIILSSAVVSYGQGYEDIGDLSRQLEPLLGTWASTFLGLGFFAAGLSSTLTAPLAAAYATGGILGWGSDHQSPRFRAVWILVLGSGLFFSLAGFKPISVILFAQFANGLLLPIIVAFLIWVMNDREILGKYTNTPLANLLALLILVVALLLGGKSIGTALGWL